MAPRKALLIAATTAMAVVVVGALLSATATAFPNNHVVGDLDGNFEDLDGNFFWDLYINYTDWALSVDVNTGETLQFYYDVNQHTVVKVDEAGYNECDATNELGRWDTGNDYVQLPSPGKHFFICDVGDHCDLGGMKLAIMAK